MFFTPQETMVLAGVVIWLIFILITVLKVRKKRLSINSLLTFFGISGLVAVFRVLLSVYLDNPDYYSKNTDWLVYLLLPERGIQLQLLIHRYVPETVALVGPFLIGSIIWLCPILLLLAKENKDVTAFNTGSTHEMETMNPATGIYGRQKEATRSLIRFCLEHGNDLQPVKSLESCLQALEDGQVDAALNYYRSVPRGGMGSFNDWLPPPVHKGETHTQALAEFDSLVAAWALSMRELESQQG